jgi:hypothetical protein
MNSAINERVLAFHQGRDLTHEEIGRVSGGTTTVVTVPPVMQCTDDDNSNNEVCKKPGG